VGTERACAERERLESYEMARRRGESRLLDRWRIRRSVEVRGDRGDSATRTAVRITEMVNGMDPTLERDDRDDYGEHRDGEPTRPPR
jgi:hypothetical protein